MGRRTEKADLLRGTLDLLILGTLSLRPCHGVGVADRIRQVTSGAFVVPAGSLFPALHRLEHDGWIEGTWEMNDQGRRVKTYALTSSGRRKLAQEQRQWTRIVEAIGQVLQPS